MVGGAPPDPLPGQTARRLQGTPCGEGRTVPAAIFHPWGPGDQRQGVFPG